MTNGLKRKLAFYIIGAIIVWFLLGMLVYSATAQEPIKSTIGPENAMTDIPDGYHLSKSDTVKCIMVASSDVWYEGMAPMSFDEPEPNFRPGYVVTEKHRFKSDGIHIMSGNRPIINKLVFLDRWKKPLKYEIVWAYKVVEEQSDHEKALNSEPQNIIGSPCTESLPEEFYEPMFGLITGEIKRYEHDFRTPQYDSNQYVRISEFQELKQKLHDQKEAYRRELMAEVLARFCTFMSPEKAAVEAVRYADGLIKELEK